MKCQKCGKNEVNFHYSSNVNGCVTETYLCSLCATESGYDIGQMFDFGGIFGLNQNGDKNDLMDLMFPMRSGIGGFMPLAIPVVQSNTNFPFTIQHRRGMIDNGNACQCGCGNKATKVSTVDVDEEMSKRRELNAMMRAAVEKEDFEKAAELRDQIKELEAQAKNTTQAKNPVQESKPEQNDIPAQAEKTTQEPLQGEGA